MFMAITVAVGKVRPELRRLLEVTRETLDIALEQIKPGKWSAEY